MVENHNLEKLGIFLKNEEIEFVAGKLGIQLLFVVKAQGVPLEQEIELFQSELVGADREKERKHLRERVKELQIVTCGRFGSAESGLWRDDLALAALHIVFVHIKRLVFIEGQVMASDQLTGLRARLQRKSGLCGERIVSQDNLEMGEGGLVKFRRQSDSEISCSRVASDGDL